MAGVQFTVTNETTTGVAVLTLMQLIAAANKRVRINRITISGKGVLNTDEPVTLEALIQTTAGTPDGSPPTVAKTNPSDDETLAVTATDGFTVEPTAGAIIASQALHPQSALVWTFPAGIRDCFVPGGGRLGIRCGVAPLQATKLRVTVEGEE